MRASRDFKQVQSQATKKKKQPDYYKVLQESIDASFDRRM